ncbi:MAG: DUF1800 family protein [Verrucomicrobiota bacterium]|nr:DUF1800 family protein [Verrucomicrobiota bacterium]
MAVGTRLRWTICVAGFAAILVGSLTAPTVAAQSVSAAANLSTRLRVETGDNVAIAGFIVTGSGQKNVAVRAIGPSLPVPGALADPILELHDASGAIIGTNDNWRSSQAAQIVAAGMAPGDDRDAVLIAPLNVGSYTAIVRGVNGAVGVALVEIYDLDPPGGTARLGNLSTRGKVLVGDEVMIGGFILRGETPKRMIMRVRGPSLSLNGSPITGRLPDPMLELRDRSGNLLAQNDDWRSTQEAEIAASSLPPSDEREPAIVATLPPGNYTAIVRGKSNSSGIGLVEIYDLDQAPQADGSTLYLAQLRPQGSATSQGSGTATLRVAADGLSAVFSFSFSNLTGPVTGMHIHGPANPGQSGGILFDPDQITPRPDGTYIWVFAPTGGYSVADILSFIRSGRTYFNLHTAAYPTGEINGFFNVSTGAQVAPVPTPPPALAAGTPSPGDAARFLSQATFGPTDPLITQVQTQGFDAFLNEQFNAPMTSQLALVDSSGVVPPTITETMTAWWTTAIAAPDQLRQRVAFALSEIMVVSINSAGLRGQPVAMSAYVDVLLRGAFGNYRDLLENVTLNPAMGKYLDMLHNDKANAATGTVPNENYAREVMQLFSVGLYRLNLDGGLTLDAQAAPIDTYSQNTVVNLSNVFTGWYFAQNGTPSWLNVTANYRVPMMPVPGHHETAAKEILSGVLLPAGQTAEADLRAALDTIFNHPNVGPFICRQLIQRLVTSNPSPGYVYRVASVFKDNGQGVRGDLRAVIRAILLDYDARGPLKTGQAAGHSREPVLRLTSLLRAFGASTPNGRFYFSGTGLGEIPLQAPTVFNFFAPDYSAPGAIAEAGLKSPELEIMTDTTVVTIANLLRTAINSGIGSADNKITLDLTNEQNEASDPALLVDHLNRVLMASSMSPGMRSILINALTQIPATNRIERVRTAIYLVVNSPEFVTER